MKATLYGYGDDISSNLATLRRAHRVDADEIETFAVSQRAPKHVWRIDGSTKLVTTLGAVERALKGGASRIVMSTRKAPGLYELTAILEVAG